jgi:hypothetical protein
MAFNFLLEICLYLHSFELFNCGDGTPYTYICTLLCTGHFLADAGEREVNLLETWNIKSFA